MNCPMNVVYYAQIAFKNLIFQARPASGMRSSNALMTVHVHRLVQPRDFNNFRNRCSDYACYVVQYSPTCC